jgi:hypothetical protein
MTLEQNIDEKQQWDGCFHNMTNIATMRKVTNDLSEKEKHILAGWQIVGFSPLVEPGHHLSLGTMTGLSSFPVAPMSSSSKLAEFLGWIAPPSPCHCCCHCCHHSAFFHSIAFKEILD